MQLQGKLCENSSFRPAFQKVPTTIWKKTILILLDSSFFVLVWNNGLLLYMRIDEKVIAGLKAKYVSSISQAQKLEMICRNRREKHYIALDKPSMNLSPEQVIELSRMLHANVVTKKDCQSQ